jgi:hypothetical protein
MEGPENLLPEIDFQYNDNTLTIRNLNTCNIVRSYKREITVHLYAPEFPHIINESTLAIDTPDTLKQKSMHWEQWQASSNAFLLIHCDSAHFEMPTGHGDLEVAGIAHQLKVYSHSIGIFDGRHLKSQSLQCNQSSLQDLYVHNNGYAYFEITNSGNVYYTGTPAQIEKKITGTGEIIPLP